MDQNHTLTVQEKRKKENLKKLININSNSKYSIEDESGIKKNRFPNEKSRSFSQHRSIPNYIEKVEGIILEQNPLKEELNFFVKNNLTNSKENLDSLNLHHKRNTKFPSVSYGKAISNDPKCNQTSNSFHKNNLEIVKIKEGIYHQNKNSVNTSEKFEYEVTGNNKIIKYIDKDGYEINSKYLHNNPISTQLRDSYDRKRRLEELKKTMIEEWEKDHKICSLIDNIEGVQKKRPFTQQYSRKKKKNPIKAKPKPHMPKNSEYMSFFLLSLYKKKFNSFDISKSNIPNYEKLIQQVQNLKESEKVEKTATTQFKKETDLYLNMPKVYRSKSIENKFNNNYINEYNRILFCLNENKHKIRPSYISNFVSPLKIENKDFSQFFEYVETQKQNDNLVKEEPHLRKGIKDTSEFNFIKNQDCPTILNSKI